MAYDRTKELTKIALRLQRQYPEESIDQLLEWAEDELADMENDARRERAEQGWEDSPCLEAGVHNCDDWGTGEGQFHGRI